jgi:hypothetical protein
VHLAIGVPHLTLLSARGKVVQPKLSGTFAVAIVFECLSLARVPWNLANDYASPITVGLRKFDPHHSVPRIGKFSLSEPT